VMSGYFNLGEAKIFNRIFIKTFNQIFVTNINPKTKDESLVKNKDYKAKKIKIFSEDHQGHYLLGYELFKSSPIFGQGPKGFRSTCRKLSYNPQVGICSTHPHNIIIQFLSELGLVGLAFYILSMIYLFNKMSEIKQKKIDKNLKNSFVCCSIGIIINLFPILPSGNFFNNWVSIMLYYYIGLYFYSFRKCSKV